MGYENPKTIINQTNKVINNEISNFNQQFNAEFDEINARQAENIEANMKILEEKKMKRELGDDLWYQQVEKYRPKGGYAEDTEAFLSNMHNKYYDLLGCDTSECRKELERLKTIPQQLSEVGGAWDALHKKYEESNNKELFSPGSFNARTPNYIQQVMENGGFTKKIYNDKTGHVEFEVYDKDGISAAHKTLPLNSIVRVTNLDNGKSVKLKINDRGPYIKGRILDCSYGAAVKLDFVEQGTTEVKVEVIKWGDNEYKK